ncbi:anti-sigma factor domain-containing protein [Streptomyces sp. NK15101]|uniref:anti-sigma factor n=1 Tax=Streptomyces sp. NK15101 TaxID=2873261 RepID=UPI001CEC9FE5|nr:anti-sigma factor [Streptomyces sp. NK15101]
MTTPEDPHLGAAAYVLHALPPAEEAAFENHLAGCETCRQDVAEFESTVARLASAETAPVPEGLRARVLEQVSHTPQDRRRHTARPRDGSRGGTGLRLALAASIVAAAALGAVAALEHTDAEEARAQAAQARAAGGTFADILTAPDATVHAGELSDGAKAAVVVSREQARAAFTARDLPTLPSGKAYELWYADRAGDLRPAGLLDDTGDRATRVLEGPLGNAVAVGITVEPAGGSAQPTTEPLGIISIST